MNLNVDYNYLLAKVEITLVILTEELKSPYGVPSLFIDKNDDKLYVYWLSCFKQNNQKKKIIFYFTLTMYWIDSMELSILAKLILNHNTINHITNEDVEKIVTRIKYGFYAFLVMPFRWSNVPSMFITFMNSTF